MSSDTEETVTISKYYYDQLKGHERLLGCMYDAGVDNWEGYDNAVEWSNHLDNGQ